MTPEARALAALSDMQCQPAMGWHDPKKCEKCQAVAKVAEAIRQAVGEVQIVAGRFGAALTKIATSFDQPVSARLAREALTPPA